MRRGAERRHRQECRRGVLGMDEERERNRGGLLQRDRCLERPAGKLFRGDANLAEFVVQPAHRRMVPLSRASASAGRPPTRANFPHMLLSREEMTFDFRGARLQPDRDRRLLAWMTNQFLYGEVTGIQCGHWLYRAPDLEAARFFSRQAVEEFQHVENFVRILKLLGEPPAPAHRMVRFLSTGMMPGSFEEHVCLEMALGGGFVLMALDGVVGPVDHEQIRAILQRAVKQEERHVDFGERRTASSIRQRPSLRRRLLGLALVSTWGVRRVG